MAYMVSTGMSVHWVKRIEASSFTEGALRLAFHGDPDASPDQSNVTDVTVFMDDDELVKRLVEAINEAANADPGDTTFRHYHYPVYPIAENDDEPAF